MKADVNVRNTLDNVWKLVILVRLQLKNYSASNNVGFCVLAFTLHVQSIRFDEKLWVRYCTL